MIEADRGEGEAIAVGPVEREFRPGEGLVIESYHGIATDEKSAHELAGFIAEMRGADRVDARRVDSERSFHAFSSRKWNVSWEPEGPIPPWGPPGNDLELS